jgi:hypothetical protein
MTPAEKEELTGKKQVQKLNIEFEEGCKGSVWSSKEVVKKGPKLKRIQVEKGTKLEESSIDAFL